MKRLYVLIFASLLIISAIGNLKAQDSPITGGYSISSYLSDSGNVYYHPEGAGMGGSIGAYTKILKGDQPGNATPYLNKIRAISANSGNIMWFLACDSTVYTSNNGTAAAHVVAGAQSPNTSGFLEKIIYITGWNYGGYFLQSDGKVMSIATVNSAGQLGNGTTTPSATPVYVLQGPAPGTPLTGVIQIQGMENGCVALKSDGTVWYWGDGANNESGPTTTDQLYAVQVPNLPPIVKLAGGDATVFALGTDGYLWSWGRANYAGMLGSNSAGISNWPPDRVLAVGAVKPSTQYLTGVVNFEAGQISAIALLDDGTLVHWGSGTNNSSPGASIPQVVMASAGVPLTGIMFVGAGDDKLMAMKADGTLYEWLGGYPVLITPKPYKKSLGCPLAYVGQDHALCNPLSDNLYAGAQSPTYKYRWYKDGTLITDSAAGYATGPNLTVNTAGTYKVIITDTSALRLQLICPCLPSQDQVVITTNATAAPINTTYCNPVPKIVTVAVNDPGNTFDWYSASTGGTLLKTGSNFYTTPSPGISANTTFYAEDTRPYNYTTGWSMGSPPGTSSQGLSGWGSQYNTNDGMNFTVLSTITLVSVDVYNEDNPTSAARQLNLETPAGAILQTATNTFGGSGVHTLTLGWTIAPGNYRLEWNAGFFNPFQYTTGPIYPIGVSGLISLTGTTTPGSNNHFSSGFFNWKITAPLNCGRIPVTATLSTSCPPLPVEFISFSGNKAGNSSYLFWSTSMEKNNALFEVQRSTNGVDFVTIGSVDGANNSSSVTNYSYVDADITSPSIYYYRLKQVDLDGASAFSTVISINHSPVGELSIQPNPVLQGQQLSLTAISAESEALHIKIYDLTGRLIYETYKSKGSGAAQFAIHTESFAKGMYILNVSSEANAYPTFKFMVE
jgi:hypothetical protein